MTADEYDVDGTTSPAVRTGSGGSPVVGGEAENGAAPTPSEQFEAHRTGDDRPVGGFGTADKTPSSTHTEESLYV
ncbi:hypothetical protein [Halorussus lipolyticus]|uniref:hypothetical protein n=1 Tax=Halorussus lipolyticus TaxID=3034024 RepID=UPI0023E8960F|nr:hypothetical protein [Halorussus sp. DT80]